MSTRMHFVSLSSLDPVRDAIASNDDELVEAAVRREEALLREDYDDDEEFEDDELLDDFREYAESMIMCDSPPDEEPRTGTMSLNGWPSICRWHRKGWRMEDWKQAYTWEPYRASVAAHITPQSRRSLEFLDEGRPLKGSRIDYDGCVFSWLSADEVKELHQSLSKLDKSLIRDADSQQFHEELVDCLKSTSERNAVLFMAAH